MLPDPTAFEQPLLATSISIALDAKGKAASVRQDGLGGVAGKSGAEVLTLAWGVAETRAKQLHAVLETSV